MSRAEHFQDSTASCGKAGPRAAQTSLVKGSVRPHGRAGLLTKVDGACASACAHSPECPAVGNADKQAPGQWAEQVAAAWAGVYLLPQPWRGCPPFLSCQGRLICPFTSLFIVRPLAYWAPVMPGTKLCPAHVSCILARAVGKGAG